MEMVYMNGVMDEDTTGNTTVTLSMGGESILGPMVRDMKGRGSMENDMAKVGILLRVEKAVKEYGFKIGG